MSGLPGDCRRLNASCTEHCENHPEIKAEWRIQGDTDSFGAEYYYYCLDCYKKEKELIQNEEPMRGMCDWCHKGGELRWHRDLDEGMSGPVYKICKPCLSKYNENEEKEAEFLRKENNDYFDD
jgi:hypothetical protein